MLLTSWPVLYDAWMLRLCDTSKVPARYLCFSGHIVKLSVIAHATDGLEVPLSRPKGPKEDRVIGRLDLQYIGCELSFLDNNVPVPIRGTDIGRYRNTNQRFAGYTQRCAVCWNLSWPSMPATQTPSAPLGMPYPGCVQLFNEGAALDESWVSSFVEEIRTTRSRPENRARPVFF